MSRGDQIGVTGQTGDAGNYRHLHFVLSTAQDGQCGAPTNAIDPYEIYQNRDYYPTPCGANYAWLSCPPTGPGAICITPTPPYPDGALFKEEHGTSIFVIYGQTKWLIHDPEDFEAMGFSWGAVQCVTDGSLASIADIPGDKTLFQEWGGSAIYIAECQAKFWVPDMDTLNYMIANGWANAPVYIIPPDESLDISDVPFNGCRMQEYGLATLWLTCRDPARKWGMSAYAWSIFAAIDSNVRIVWPGALNGMTTLATTALRTCPDSDDGQWVEFTYRWSDLAEQYMGTDPYDACADDTVISNERGPAYGEQLSPWPPDINDNQLVNGSDALALNFAMGKRPPDPDYNRRFDMNTNDLINGSDWLAITTLLGTYCTLN